MNSLLRDFFRLGRLRFCLSAGVIFGLTAFLTAEDVSSYDEQLARGHEAVYRLDFAQADGIFKGLIAGYPERPGAYAFLALTRWNQLLQAAGNLALDDYATPTPFARKPNKPVVKEREAFLAANQMAITVSDRILSKDPLNTRALYFKGVSYENLASEAVAIRKEPWEAWGYGRTATRLHRQVLNLDPDFVDAKLSLAVAEFAKATVPWSIRWFTALFFPGDKDHALTWIREVAEKGHFRSLDAQVVLGLLQAWKGDPQVSVVIFDQLRQAYPSNYLLDLNLAAIQLQSLESPKAALETYRNLLAHFDMKKGGLKLGEVYYRLGLTYQRLREYSEALDALQRALDSPTMEKETDPLSAYWMAQIYEERGESAEANRWYRRMLEIAPPGDSLNEELKIARRKTR